MHRKKKLISAAASHKPLFSFFSSINVNQPLYPFSPLSRQGWSPLVILSTFHLPPFVPLFPTFDVSVQQASLSGTHSDFSLENIIVCDLQSQWISIPFHVHHHHIFYARARRSGSTSNQPSNSGRKDSFSVPLLLGFPFLVFAGIHLLLGYFFCISTTILPGVAFLDWLVILKL